MADKRVWIVTVQTDSETFVCSVWSSYAKAAQHADSVRKAGHGHRQAYIEGLNIDECAQAKR